MIWVTYTGKRILRNFAPVIALLAVPFVLVMLLSWLVGVTEHQRQQLEGFYKLPIICEVTDLHGNTGRPITYNYAYLFTEPGQPLAEYAKNVRLRKTLYFQLDGEEQHLVGVNAFDASEAFLMGSERSVSSMQPYGEHMLKGRDRILWVNQTWLYSSEFKLGGKITLTVYDNTEGSKRVTESFRIVGTFVSDKKDFLVPWGTICEMAQEIGDAAYYTRYTEIIRFTLADNRKLAEFKEAASPYFSEIDVTADQHSSKKALVIHDEQYRNSLLSTQRTIRLMEILAPLFYVLALGVGFLTGFVFARNRRKEFFLLRCLGVRPGIVLRLTVTEQLLFCVLGVAAGAFASMPLWQTPPSVLSIILLALCFSLGTFVSVYLLLRVSLMTPKEE